MRLSARKLVLDRPRRGGLVGPASRRSEQAGRRSHRQIEVVAPLGPRSGFTLVELLVVILIIAVLVGLLSSAGAKAIARAKQVRNKSEIEQITIALENFKSKYGFYPPSRIKLCEKYIYYNLGNPSAVSYQLDVDSVGYLQRMFPRIDLNGTPGVSWNDQNPGNGSGWMNWCGKPTNTFIQPPTPPTTVGGEGDGAWVLQGDQCLAFFLGGIPGNAQVSTVFVPEGPTGFNTNPSNPTLLGGTRTPPFFEFATGRLVNRVGSGSSFVGFLHPQNYGSPTAPRVPNLDRFYSYVDQYSTLDSTVGGALAPGGAPPLGIPGGNPPGTPPPAARASGAPYAYFSSYKTANGYNKYGSSDCPDLASSLVGQGFGGVWPYFESSGQVAGTFTYKFVNPNTYQLVSAGADNRFGQGVLPFLPPGQNTNLYTWTPSKPLSNPQGGATRSTAMGGVPITSPDQGTLGSIQGSTSLYPGPWGYDDQSNFYDTLLGVASN